MPTSRNPIHPRKCGRSWSNSSMHTLRIRRERPPIHAKFRPGAALLVLVLSPALLPAQTSVDVRNILDRLDRLERQNQSLLDEVRALRGELTAARGAQNPALAD